MIAGSYDRQMQRLTFLFSLIATASAQAADTPDISLYRRALSRDTIYEMHCRGMPIDDAEQHFDRKYKARQDRLRASLSDRHLLDPVEPNQEIIPIGFKCPHYRGEEAHLKAALRQSERRLGVR
ncbi:hypothetical protein HZF05_17275 [Sphingomonas sp. CGMCC 1.13654]|uniref:Uncharacterized protein n=1 Tax=Sphingomonas chungangi TaxID=2683589 RepID=A0A838L9H3_9SPHN|nr:hypothetical protein [Sphingomonas chungangi]MBA2935834.1 hypothetical protein [Sphingomonas chungangi]MVW54525.1 hypothetical protein [Sphingomonas chungangi]